MSVCQDDANCLILTQHVLIFYYRIYQSWVKIFASNGCEQLSSIWIVAICRITRSLLQICQKESWEQVCKQRSHWPWILEKIDLASILAEYHHPTIFSLIGRYGEGRFHILYVANDGHEPELLSFATGICSVLWTFKRHLRRDLWWCCKWKRNQICVPSCRTIWRVPNGQNRSDIHVEGQLLSVQNVLHLIWQWHKSTRLFDTDNMR